MSETVPEPKSVLCKAEPELDPDADPDSISAKDTETLDVTQDQNSVTTQEIVIDTEEAVMDDPDIEDVDYLVEEEEELEQDYEETKADDVPVRDSRLRRNPPRSRKAPKKFKRRSTLKENRLPIKSEFSEDDLETDFVTVSADVLPEDSGPHPFADLPASELLVKFRLLEYAHNQLKEKVKKQHRDLSHKLSNTSSKHSKSVFRVKALDAENRALKKHIKLIESQEKKGDSPAYVPPARSVGRPQRRLQIMRGTQTRVRDWTYLDLPIDADTGERVGKVIFSDDEAEELRVMKDKRPSASSAVGKKRRKRGGKKGGADDSDGDEQDEAMLQEQMLAEAEKAERSKEVEDGNAKIEETTVIDTATTSTSTIEENVPQPGKLVEIQASPSPLALKAVRPPPFFPKAIRASTSPTPVVSQAATVAPRQAVAVPQATVVQTVVAQQVPPQPQPPQAHTVQQTIHIPASALNLHQGHHGGPQVTVVQHPHHVQQIQQQGGQPQQHHQEVVYLLNTGPDGQTTATEMQANEFMIKDMTQKWV